MKIKIFFISAIMLLSFQSCSKWLDVSPKDTIAEEDFFKVGTGYRNALNGVYKQMSSSSLYGQELSWGMVDVLGQCYDVYDIYNLNPYYKLADDYDYTSKETKPYFESIWKTAYNTIANCNNIVGKIQDEPNSKFKGGELEKDLIQGEAIAVRAFLHFDILRLYGAAPIANDNEKYIPYYDKYPSLGAPRVSVKEALDKIIVDLKKAQEFVAQYDTTDLRRVQLLSTLHRFTAINIKDITIDLFFTHRGYRMNYYAITAILARVYNYAGKHAEAAIEAQKVISATSENIPLFSFTTFEASKKDRKLTNDLIFTLSEPKLYDNYNTYYIGTKSGTSTPLVLDNYTDDWNDLFSDKSDCRINLVEALNSYGSITSNKNVPTKSTTEEAKMIEDMLPIIRMSEMHLIIAESHAANGDFVAAATAIDIVRMGRNCMKGQLSIYDFESFRSELISEANREFFGEGQLFFYYKKHNVKPSNMRNLNSFILPRPDAEEVN